VTSRQGVGLVQRTVAAVAALFGFVTVVAGGRVLAGGSDPGYVVFRPLLIYNTAMGVAYVATGFLAWRSVALGRKASAAIFALNLIVLVAISLLRGAGEPVAVESLAAMTFRTAVWLGLFLILRWAAHRVRPKA
jgi:hypothetical protein